MSVAEFDFLDSGDASLLPGGAVAASDYRNGFEPGKAVDGLPGTEWSALRGGTQPGDVFLTYTFSAPVSPAKASITARNDGYANHCPTVVGIESSPDGGTSWDLVQIAFKDTPWSSGETSVYDLSATAFDTRNTRVGNSTNLGYEVMGTTYTAEADFLLQGVEFRTSSSREVNVTVARLGTGSDTITALLGSWESGSAATEHVASFGAGVPILAGQRFAILVSRGVSEATLDPRVSEQDLDNFPLLASRDGTFYQTVRNVAPGQTSDVAEATVPLFFLTGTWANDLPAPT